MLHTFFFVIVAAAVWDLCGVEVCGEVSVVAHSSRSLQFEWKGYGLKLYIEEDSLPAGVEHCTINIKASIAGQYEFPENSPPVSAVFWFSCETVRKFIKPIIVEIQHCAKVESINDHSISFVRAVCSQKQLPYTFKLLPKGVFTSHSSYGVIELNNFSGVGVIQQGLEEREYYSRLVYLIQRSEVHFIVTWNVDAHLTVSMIIRVHINFIYYTEMQHFRSLGMNMRRKVMLYSGQINLLSLSQTWE